MESILRRMYYNDPTVFIEESELLHSDFEEACTDFKCILEQRCPELLDAFVALWRENSSGKAQHDAAIFAKGARVGARIALELLAEEKTMKALSKPYP